MEVYHVSTSLNRIPSSAAGALAHSHQPQRVVGGLQERSVSETRQTRPAHNGVEGNGYCRASGKAHRRSGGKMTLVFSPALRPSRPHGCRKRAFRQGYMCQMFARCRRHTPQRHAGYRPAPRPFRTRHISDARIMRLRFCADACSFVRPCLRGPAYVSSIRRAYSLTAGKGRCPFEPRKGKRQGKR